MKDISSSYHPTWGHLGSYGRCGREGPKKNAGTHQDPHVKKCVVISMQFDPIWREYVYYIYILSINLHWYWPKTRLRVQWFNDTPSSHSEIFTKMMLFLDMFVGFNCVTGVTRWTFFWQFPGANPKTSRRWCARVVNACAWNPSLWGGTCIRPRLLSIFDCCLSCKKIMLCFRIMVSPWASMDFRLMAKSTG